MSDEKIVGFIPDYELTANENLEKFIAQSKAMLLSIFPEKYKLKWESPVWSIGDSLANEKNRTANFYFTTKGPTIRHNKDLRSFSASFSDFAKAFIVYFVKMGSHLRSGSGLRALRFLYAVLRRSFKDPSIIKLQPLHLDLAVNMIKSVYSNERTRGAYIKELNVLSAFVNEHRLVERGFRWGRTVSHRNYQISTSEQARQIREDKLPDRESLLAVARAFHLAKTPADQFVTSVMALLSIAPSRICEIFRLSKDIYVKRYEKGEEVHEMRWRPAKGGKEGLKSIPEVMIDVFWKAYNQIIEHTADAREMAKWYEHNSTQLYLPKRLEFLRNEPTKLYPIKYFAEIAWQDPSTSLATWFKRNKVKTEKTGEGSQVGYQSSFEELEKAILRRLPTHFPYTDKTQKLKFSEALVVLPHKFFFMYVSEVMFQKTCIDSISRQFSGTSGYASVFDRLNIKRTDGSPIIIRTHQFRHWLNTIAQETGELSQEDIAMWSGRSDIPQNLAYDHSDKDKMLQDIRALVVDQKPSDEAQITTYRPVSPAEFKAMRDRPPTHATKFGFCLHDYAMSPCQKFLDCINCSEHCFVKGLKAQDENLRLLDDIYQHELSQAEEMIAAGEMSESNTWYQTARKGAGHVSAIKGIYDDNQFPDGTPMMINVENEHDPMLDACTLRHRLTGEETIGSIIKAATGDECTLEDK